MRVADVGFMSSKHPIFSIYIKAKTEIKTLAIAGNLLIMSIFTKSYQKVSGFVSVFAHITQPKQN